MSAGRLITPVIRLKALVRPNHLIRTLITGKKTVPSNVQPGISHQLIVPEQYEQVLDLFNKYFMPGHPLHKYLGCTEKSQAMDNAVLGSLKENLSWCAVEERSGKIIGVCLNREKSLVNLPDTPPTYEELLEQGYPKKTALILVTYDIVNIKQLLVEYQETKLIEIHRGVIHPEFIKRGILTEGLIQSMKHGAELGYRLCYAPCASLYTQKFAERMGFKIVKEIEYASYIHPVTNTCLFKDMEGPHKYYKFCVQKLSD